MGRKGKIYQIVNDINDKVYIGSTFSTLKSRMFQHRSSINIKRVQHRPMYADMREFGREHFKIYLIEEVEVENRDELTKREGEWIRELGTHKTGYNRVVNGRTNKEYYRDNRERVLEQKKDYREEHRDKIATHQKIYYDKNRDKIAEQYKTKYACECGSIIRRGGKNEHLKTKKHQKYMASIDPEDKVEDSTDGEDIDI